MMEYEDFVDLLGREVDFMDNLKSMSYDDYDMEYHVLTLVIWCHWAQHLVIKPDQMHKINREMIRRKLLVLVENHFLLEHLILS